MVRTGVNDKPCAVKYLGLVIAGASFQIELSLRTVEDEREALEDAQSDTSG
jgi:hypothetical protein